MNRRLELHELLCEALGSRQVYFQPPTNVGMQYPAIVYSRDDIRNNFADNDVYLQHYMYKVSLLPKCKFDRHYVADNLNHDVFTIYY